MSGRERFPRRSSHRDDNSRDYTSYKRRSASPDRHASSSRHEIRRDDRDEDRDRESKRSRRDDEDRRERGRSDKEKSSKT